MLKTSTSHGDFHDAYGEKGSLKVIKECGFDGVDFGFQAYQNDKDFILLKSDNEVIDHFKRVKEYADSLNLEFAQAHAPFYGSSYNSKFLDKDFCKRYDNAIKATSTLGCKTLVIHSVVFDDPDNTYKKNLEYNVKYYSSFIPLMEKYNVDIAIENLDAYNPIKKTSSYSCVTSAEKIIDLIEHLNHKGFVACLDVGHALCSGHNPSHLAKLLGKYLKVLHLHDNDADFDMHVAPMCGYIDWNEFANTLAKINFDGYINFEVSLLRSGINNVKELGTFLNAIARHLIKMIEKR